MCGIFGYIGERDVVEVLLAGLKRLQYRGYDWCGIAVLDGGELAVVKEAGRIERLEQAPSRYTFQAKVGIAHTRWRRMAPLPRSTPILIPIVKALSPSFTTASLKTTSPFGKRFSNEVTSFGLRPTPKSSPTLLKKRWNQKPETRNPKRT